MGIGRREFLKVCGQAFAGFAVASTNSIALLDDLYVNRRFGVAFRKPPGWQFSEVQRLAELAAGQILATEDFQLTPDMLEWLGQPFVVVQREMDARNAVAPSAQFFLLEDCPLFAQIEEAVRGLRQIMGEMPPKPSTSPPMLRKANEDANACSELFKSFTVTERPAPMTLSECPSAGYTAEYLFEHVELANAVRVRVKTIFALHGKLAYLIRLVDAPYQEPGEAFCFDSFVSSIAFV